MGWMEGSKNSKKEMGGRIFCKITELSELRPLPSVGGQPRVDFQRDSGFGKKSKAALEPTSRLSFIIIPLVQFKYVNHEFGIT